MIRVKYTAAAGQGSGAAEVFLLGVVYWEGDGTVHE